ncbi:HAMP domain-containing protein [Deinococcus radiophilus]|uniref:HAMP domain-containing protein n=1 Tax=Deinococcus radiophilus TaxID=32062 RepID=A0A3S0RIY2_9DEIO|nr:HAMP domain-containing protein [Deinococcus radiophilus]RTR29429.1 HAMP domain-containing protein [Deinococcus radiophilus]UFA50739.1 HAMP domain-containing protein [Deinococcus radiophilus]
MKYTVVIQQPIQDERRPELEQQLQTQLGLGQSAAAKLAARRAGRLLKPTTRAKAEKLLGLFRQIGADVTLEEVPEEGEITSLAALGSVPAVGSGSLGGLGGTPTAVPAQAQPSPLPDASADPFGLDPFGADPFGLPDDLSVTTSQVFRAAPGAVTGSSVAADPAAPTALQGRPALDPLREKSDDLAVQATEEDVWADFADALRVDVPAEAPREVQAAAPLTPTFLDATDEPAVTTRLGPRRSLLTQLQQAALLPAATLGLLTFLLLSALLPGQRQQRHLTSAQTVAESFSAGLNVADPLVMQQQLDTLVASEGVGFAQVTLPDGTVAFASDAEAADRTALQNSFAEWQGRQGVFREDETYSVGRVSGAADVAVGLPYVSGLASLLIPMLLTALLLLGAAYAWAGRAARDMLEPIQRLVRSADAISSGDLSQPVQAEANNEVGDLAEALERMRVSLSAAMDRLRRRKR